MTLPLILSLMAAAAAPAPLHFDLSDGSALRRQSYRAGGHGMEPGGAADDYLFSVALPPGNYRVTVRLGDPARAGDTTVKAEARRLMLRNVATRPGQFVERSFIVNIRTPALAPPPGDEALRRISLVAVKALSLREPRRRMSSAL